jgi:hypothetical protein
MKVGSIRIRRSYIKALTLLFLAIWCPALFAVWRVGLGKGLSYLSMFLTMDFFLCPFIVSALIALLAYDTSLNFISGSRWEHLIGCMFWSFLVAFVFLGSVFVFFGFVLVTAGFFSPA